MLGARHPASGNAILESCQSEAAIDQYPPTRELSDQRCGCASALSSAGASPAVRQPHRTQRVPVGARGSWTPRHRASIVRASPVVQSARACRDSVPSPRPREGGGSVGRGAGPGAPCERLPRRLRSAHRGSVVARCRARRDRTAPLQWCNPPAGLPARRVGQAPAEGVHLRARAGAGVSPGCARDAERRGPRAGGNRALAAAP